MYLDGKNPRDLTADDVRYLIEKKVPEDRNLEYKRELPGKRDKDRTEFLRDETVAKFSKP